MGNAANQIMQRQRRAKQVPKAALSAVFDARRQVLFYTTTAVGSLDPRVIPVLFPRDSCLGCT